jgi:hypothetical protein
VVKQRHQKLIPLRYYEKLPDDVMLLSGATLSSVVTTRRWRFSLVAPPVISTTNPRAGKIAYTHEPLE